RGVETRLETIRLKMIERALGSYCRAGCDWPSQYELEQFRCQSCRHPRLDQESSAFHLQGPFLPTVVASAYHAGSNAVSTARRAMAGPELPQAGAYQTAS